MALPGRTQIDWGKLLSLALSFGLSLWSINYMVAKMDPESAAKAAIKHQSRVLEQRLGRKIPPLVGLEGEVAAEVVNPDDIDVTLADIGGLDVESRTLAASIMLPLKHSHLFQSYLLHQPNGVLLYGPPGTGKTMLAKAIAREAGASFISIKASTLQSKWFGQSQKMVRAVFSLAAKLVPSIIFVDEVDGLLGTRRGEDHEATLTMKTEFMQLWDGLDSERGAQILVLGATNRQSQLDPAVLRRFTLQIKVPMPDKAARVAILTKVLRRHACTSHVDPLLLEYRPAPDSEPAEFSASPATVSQLEEVAAATEGYSGADLMELCSQAAIIPVQEYIEATSAAASAAAATAAAATAAAGAAQHASTSIPGSTKAAACASPAQIILHEPRALNQGDLLEVVRRSCSSRLDMTADHSLAAEHELMNSMLVNIMKAANSSQNSS